MKTIEMSKLSWFRQSVPTDYTSEHKEESKETSNALEQAVVLWNPNASHEEEDLYPFTIKETDGSIHNVFLFEPYSKRVLIYNTTSKRV